MFRYGLAASPPCFEGYRMTEAQDFSFRSSSMEFAGFVLMHSAAIAEGNNADELICPFAILMNSQGRRVVDFEADTQQDAIEHGWACLDQSRERDELWSLAREGLKRTQTAALDVLAVSVWAPGQSEPFTVVQAFGRDSGRHFHLIGEPELFVGGRDSIPVPSGWGVDALYRGIASHPKGKRWSSWLGT